MGTDQQMTDVAIARTRDLAEEYTRLARSIEDAIRPEGSGRPIDRLRRLLETPQSQRIDDLRIISNDATAGAASCYLRLVARVAERACVAASEDDRVAGTAASFLLSKLSSQVLTLVHEAEISLDEMAREG